MNPINKSAEGILRCHIPSIYCPIDIPIHALAPNSNQWDWYIISLGATAINPQKAQIAVKFEWEKLTFQ